MHIQSIPTDEIWRPVVGFEDTYEVSSIGRVRRSRTWRQHIAGQGLKGFTGYGYAYVALCRLGEPRRNARVHRLVAEAFIPNPGQKPQINHIDGVKLNNRVENLEWVTPAENIHHAHRTGLSHAPLMGERNGRHTLTAEHVCEIRTLLGTASQESIAAMYGVGQNSISRIKRGVTWRSV